MRLLPSDPDIETIVSRIKSGDIDLQPDFQRGEVWSQAKKQRLVDSVLRDWHVPPIHVIEDVQSRKQEVLDGQQRLVAIRDFVDGEFALDGKIEPLDDGLALLHGHKYRDLPGLSDILCKRGFVHSGGSRSSNWMVNRVSAAFQSRIGMVHFWLMFLSAR